MPVERCRWGGVVVVLGDRESRSRGEGRQRKEQDVAVMSEDAPVNIGATGWPSVNEAHVVVRRIQNKLHCWAGSEGARRFDDLYNLVCDPCTLMVAWERVAGNTGATHGRGRPGHRCLDRLPVWGGAVPAPGS